MGTVATMAKIRADVCRLPRFWGAIFLVLFSVGWTICCMLAISEVPKCRYGTKECFFVRQLKDYTGYTADVFMNRAVEGDRDDDWDLTQLAVPFLVTCLSLIPPLFVFVGVVFGHTPKWMEMGQFFISAWCVAMVFSVQVMDYLTFDCRWWKNDKQDQCKRAYGAFVVGAIFLILTQIGLLVLAVYHTEKAKAYEDEEKCALIFAAMQPEVRVRNDAEAEVSSPPTPTMGSSELPRPRFELDAPGITTTVN